jgi:2-methylcitrate dehydratase PrpD
VTAAASTVTSTVAALVANTTIADLPGPVQVVARRAVLDTLGVTLAGVREESARLVRTVAITESGSGPCTVAGTRLRASAADAALANGTAAHALDFDDTHDNVRGHPSAPIVAAAIAIGELRHSTGGELLTAYAVGLEVAGKVGRSLGTSHAKGGFHSTSTVGVLGAAAASAHLCRLSPSQTAAALGIAASRASGLRRSFGSMTKPLHAGEAARSGVLAALLAGQDFSAAPGVLDGPGSFVEIFSPHGDARPALIDGLGDPWEAVQPGVAVKKYPCCNRGHRALDAVLALRDRLALNEPNLVEQVEVRMPAGQVDQHGRVGPMTYPRPHTGLEAKFSMQYVVAAALFDGELAVAAFSDAAARRPAVRALMSRVRVVSDPARPTGDPRADYVEVVLRMRDGRTESQRVHYPRGDPRGGALLSDDEVEAKFLGCARGVLPDAGITRVIEMVARLDAVDDVAMLAGLLRPDA